MKNLILLFLIILFTGCELIPEEEIPNVYLFLGQSNAKSSWFTGIKNGLLKYDPDGIYIWQNHGGASIATWYNSEPKENYISDISLIVSQLPEEYNIKSLFWFQGESDYGEEKSSLYEERFSGFIDTLESDLNDYVFDIFMTYVYRLSDGAPHIREVQINMVDNNDNYFGIDSKDYERVDNVHLINREHWRIGKDTSLIAVSLYY